MQIPRLETQRLILRPHTAQDLEACAFMWGHPEVVRYISGKPFTEQETWGKMMRYLGHWSLTDYGYWAVEEKSSGLFIGELGFADFKRDIEPSVRDFPELGWVFTPSSWGQGYATEALNPAIEWADQFISARRTVCIIAPENLASIRVAEKVGYQEYKRSSLMGEPCLFYERFAK